MAYRLEKADRNLQDALRRIARDELNAALAKLGAAEAPAPTTVHEVRKHVKKLRGLLRMVRPGFAAFREETAALRDAAQSLSGLRDAEVLLATFDRLVARDRPAHLTVLRAHLESARVLAVTAPAPTDAARAALTDVRSRAEHWKLKGRDHDLLIAGLSASRHLARAAMAEARVTRDMVALHDWRKRVKDGWYQARLLTPVWPAVMAPLADQAGLVGEDLGEHHDLGVLTAWIAALPDSAAAPDLRAEAIARARSAMDTLETRIFPMGATLLAGKPEAVARLWVGWWRVWHDQPETD